MLPSAARSPPAQCALAKRSVLEPGSACAATPGLPVCAGGVSTVQRVPAVHAVHIQTIYPPACALALRPAVVQQVLVVSGPRPARPAGPAAGPRPVARLSLQPRQQRPVAAGLWRLVSVSSTLAAPVPTVLPMQLLCEVSTAPAAPSGPAQPLRKVRASASLGAWPGLADLPPEMMQEVAGWLPSFGARAQLRCLGRMAMNIEWRLAAPRHLEEELSGFRLGDVGARAVAAALMAPQNAALRELCLGGNDIGDEGAEAVAVALATQGVALRRLSLRDNRITDKGARALAAALARNSTLEEIDLWGNELSEQGKLAVICAASCEVFLESPRAGPRQACGTLADRRMRATLFDWISQVHTGVHVPPVLDATPDPQDMLFRTYSHMDAYLAQREVRPASLPAAGLQLIGIACTLVAAGLDMGDALDDIELGSWLAFVADGACTVEEARAAAREVRRALGYQLHQPTVYTFLRRYLRRTGWTEESFSLANYLVELVAVEGSFLEFGPRAVAAAAAVLSRQYLSQGISVRHMSRWKTKLLRCAQIDLQHELAPCAAEMGRVHAARHSRANMFVNIKYEWARLHMVAKLRPNPPCDASYFVTYLSADTPL